MNKKLIILKLLSIFSLIPLTHINPNDSDSSDWSELDSNDSFEIIQKADEYKPKHIIQIISSNPEEEEYIFASTSSSPLSWKTKDSEVKIVNTKKMKLLTKYLIAINKDLTNDPDKVYALNKTIAALLKKKKIYHETKSKKIPRPYTCKTKNNHRIQQPR